MELHVLKVFCDLVESGSFTQAAENNYVSQSAVSQQIRSLEREYGQIFLERGRGKGKVILTEAGSILYNGSRPVLAEIEELESRLRGLSEEIAGTVRVATVYSVGLHALPGRLKPFLAMHPSVNVHLEYSQTEKVYLDVINSAVDVGIVACPSDRAGIDVVPFGVDEMVLVCASENPYALRETIALSELADAPFVAFSNDIPTRRLIDSRLASAGVHVRIVMSFDNIETIKNVVEIGSGVTILPESSVRQEAREGNLKVIRLSESDQFTRDVGLLLKSNRTRRASVRAFVEAVSSPQS